VIGSQTTGLQVGQAIPAPAATDVEHHASLADD
jgi:hypothetical protein